MERIKDLERFIRNYGAGRLIATVEGREIIERYFAIKAKI